MSMYGADVGALEAAASQLDAAADQLDRSAAQLGSTLGAVRWLGAVAVGFSDIWNSRHRPGIATTAGFLRDSAATLRNQAAEQRGASNSDGPGRQPHARVGPDLRDPETDKIPRRFWFDDREDLEKRNFSDQLPLIDNGISPDDVYQGHLGDCYFAAALSAIATSPEGRRFLEQMIHDNGDGTYTVTFADGQQVTVDGDLYINDKGGVAYGRPDGGDLWYAIAEKAYAERCGGYDDIGAGGNAESVFKAFGLEDAGHRDPDGLSDADLANQVRNQIESGGCVTASAELNSPGHRDGGEFYRTTNEGGNHAFTVLGVYGDGADAAIQVRNPWGVASDLHADGVTINADGTMLLTPQQFKALFYRVDYASA